MQFEIVLFTSGIFVIYSLTTQFESAVRTGPSYTKRNENPQPGVKWGKFQIGENETREIKFDRFTSPKLTLPFRLCLRSTRIIQLAILSHLRQNKGSKKQRNSDWFHFFSSFRQEAKKNTFIPTRAGRSFSAAMAILLRHHYFFFQSCVMTLLVLISVFLPTALERILSRKQEQKFIKINRLFENNGLWTFFFNHPFLVLPARPPSESVKLIGSIKKTHTHHSIAILISSSTIPLY